MSVAIVAFFLQRQWLIWLNLKKEREWNAMSLEDKVVYQSDQAAREKDGNKRLDFKFAY